MCARGLARLLPHSTHAGRWLGFLPGGQGTAGHEPGQPSLPPRNATRIKPANPEKRFLIQCLRPATTPHAPGMLKTAQKPNPGPSGGVFPGGGAEGRAPRQVSAAPASASQSDFVNSFARGRGSRQPAPSPPGRPRPHLAAGPGGHTTAHPPSSQIPPPGFPPASRPALPGAVAPAAAPPQPLPRALRRLLRPQPEPPSGGTRRALMPPPRGSPQCTPRTGFPTRLAPPNSPNGPHPGANARASAPSGSSSRSPAQRGTLANPPRPGLRFKPGVRRPIASGSPVERQQCCPIMSQPRLAVLPSRGKQPMRLWKKQRRGKSKGCGRSSAFSALLHKIVSEGALGWLRPRRLWWCPTS